MDNFNTTFVLYHILVIKIDNFDLTRIIIINIKALSEVRSPNRFEIPEIEHSERGAGPLSGGKHHQVSLRRLWRATAPVGCCKPVMRCRERTRGFLAQGAR